LNKDRKATAEFVERYTDCVYSYVRWRVMPQADAVEDLVQEVFLAAWHSLENFRGESDLRHWLLGIARHKIEDYYRKRLREPEVPDEIDQDPSEQAVIPALEAQLDHWSSLEKTHRVLTRLKQGHVLATIFLSRLRSLGEPRGPHIDVTGRYLEAHSNFLFEPPQKIAQPAELNVCEARSRCVPASATRRGITRKLAALNIQMRSCPVFRSENSKTSSPRLPVWARRRF